MIYDDTGSLPAMWDKGDSEAGSGLVTGPSDNEQVPAYTRLKRAVMQGHRHRRSWRIEAKRAYDFVANDQWSEEDMRKLQEQNRPAVSFNRAAPIIEAVCGLEVNNRQTVAYLPRVQGATGVNESYTAAGRWIRDECHAEDEESEAFKDDVICGEGWTETAMLYDDVPKGKITERRIDPLEMGVDVSAMRANYEDAKVIYRIRLMESEDAEALFDGRYNAQVIHARWLEDEDTPVDGGLGNKRDYPDTTREALLNDVGNRRKVRVVQVQWWDREPWVLLAEEGAQDLQELSASDFAIYKKRVDAISAQDTANQAAYSKAVRAHGRAMDAHQQTLMDHGRGLADGSIDPAAPLPVAPQDPGPPPQPQAPRYTHATVKKKVYYEAFLGTDMLDRKKMAMQEFQFKCMTGKRDRTHRCFYGLMRDMFDPQMWANKWMSQTMHIMNTNAKGGIMAETDAFVNVRKAEKDWADNTKIVWVKPGSLQKKKIQERTAPPLPQGLGELMQFALTALRDVTGVNLELLGQADREQAASLEMQRRQSAMTILATMFDSLRRYRKVQGRLLLHFIQLLPQGTLVRILDQGQYKYIPLMKDPSVEHFDVIIDQTPTTPDQKQMTWSLTLEIIRSGIPLPPPVLFTLLKYSPYPEQVVQEIMNAAGMGQTLPPQVLQQKLQQAEQALQQMQKALVQAEQGQKTAEDERSIKASKVTVEAYNAETQRLAAELTGATSQLNTQAMAIVKAAEANIPDAPGADGSAGSPGAGIDIPGLAQSLSTVSQLLQQMMHRSDGGSAMMPNGAPIQAQRMTPAKINAVTALGQQGPPSV
jgi:hypothetical protein